MSKAQFEHDDTRAKEFMRRLSAAILAAADTDETETMADIEMDMGMTIDEATTILERSLRPN
jgi:hypothetical protein